MSSDNQTEIECFCGKCGPEEIRTPDLFHAMEALYRAKLQARDVFRDVFFAKHW